VTEEHFIAFYRRKDNTFRGSELVFTKFLNKKLSTTTTTTTTISWG